MASVQKTATGYRVQLYVRGVRDSKTFRTLREANAWKAARTAELMEESIKAPSELHSIGDMLRRYRDEVTPSKRGARWEEVRINMFLADEHFPHTTLLKDATPDICGKWRDWRLKKVKPGTVLREFNILSAAFEAARREWKWLEVNPIKDTGRPPQPDHREVVIERWQVRLMLKALGYSRRKPISQVRHVVAVVFLVALRTGMRAGEITGLPWSRVHDDYCVLPMTKTKRRNVPLPYKAKALIERMRGWDEEDVFGIPSATLDAMFRKYRDRAGLSGFTFHDSRHTAATWLAPHMDILDLCKSFGWKDPKRAMIYYNPTASQIAKKLNAQQGPRRSVRQE